MDTIVSVLYLGEVSLVSIQVLQQCNLERDLKVPKMYAWARRDGVLYYLAQEVRYVLTQRNAAQDPC
jgi:hypothetical protein